MFKSNQLLAKSDLHDVAREGNIQQDSEVRWHNSNQEGFPAGVTMAKSRLVAHVWCGLDSAQEQRNKPGQAVLVHGVNACQVSDAEEEQAGSNSH